jgi:transposase
MEELYSCCCGLDVHKDTVVACLLGKRKKQIRTFGTMTADLLTLVDWLREAGCAHGAMESTGVYWKPIYNVLEGSVEILLVNSRHIKMVPGRKTDVSDCEWIAQLLQHGLLRGSFVPPRPVRELRDLTRHRSKLSQQRATVANRIQKVLEDANIKLGSVASDVLGRSGLAILQALIAGQQDVVVLANLARGRLKSKTNQLRKSLEGRLTDHHRFLLGELLDQVQYLDQAMARISAEIERRMVPLQETVRLLDTIPGIDRRAAENLIAELGPDMSQFPTARNLASWAGMCPGQNESAGKRRSGRTRKGSRWLRRSLCEAAWAGSRTKGTYLKAQYHRLAARRGRKRAIMAVGHTILVVIYHLLKHGAVYQELGENFFDHLQRDRLARYLVKRLEKLGHKVTLEPHAA